MEMSTCIMSNEYLKGLEIKYRTPELLYVQ